MAKGLWLLKAHSVAGQSSQQTIAVSQGGTPRCSAYLCWEKGLWGLIPSSPVQASIGQGLYGCHLATVQLWEGLEEQKNM